MENLDFRNSAESDKQSLSNRASRLEAELVSRKLEKARRSRAPEYHRYFVKFPLGMFAAAVLLDCLTVFNDSVSVAYAAYYCLLLGVLSALVALTLGIAAWWSLKDRADLKRHAFGHGVLASTSLALFIYSLILRLASPDDPAGFAVGLNFAGFALLVWAASKGYKMVKTLGVAIDPDAFDSTHRLTDQESEPEDRQVANS